MLSTLCIIAIITHLSSAQRIEQVPEGGYVNYLGNRVGYICPRDGVVKAAKVTSGMSRALVQGTTNTKANWVPFQCSRNTGQIIVWTCWLKNFNIRSTNPEEQCPPYQAGRSSGGHNVVVTARKYGTTGAWQAPGHNWGLHYHATHVWGRCIYTKTCPAPKPKAPEQPQTKRQASVQSASQSVSHIGVARARMEMENGMNT